MKIRTLTLWGLVAGFVILLAVNALSTGVFRSIRLDLTENKLYTLSDGTRNVLEGIDEPVTLRLFLSQEAATRLPGISGYALRVRELLEEYARRAPEGIKLRIIDPEPFSEEEDRALAYGLQGVPLDDRDSILYFGLVGTSATDDEQIIPFFSLEREELLEYDLTKLIHQLVNPEPPVVGLMSTLPVDGFGAGMPIGQGARAPLAVVEQIRQLFEVRTVATDAAVIPAEVDLLMLVHPKDLGERTLYAIDQFVLGGGRALVFVDPFAEADPAGGGMGMPGSTRSDLDRLLGQWGVTLSETGVVADLQAATRVQTQRDGRVVVVDYPVWMSVPPEQLDREDVVTSMLGHVLFATAGALISNPPEGVTVTALATSGPSAAEIDIGKLGFGADPEDILRDYRPAGAALNLALRVTGPLISAFPDGAPEDADADAEDGSAAEQAADQIEHLAESVEDANLIVVGDSDLLQDRFWVQVQDLLGAQIAIPTAANGDFVVNALDNLAGSGDLIAVRSRGSFSKPFTLVQAIRQDAELRFRETEQQLLDELTATEQRLVQLDRARDDDAVLLTAEQQREIDRFRQEKVRIRKQLRDVRHELHKDIERLEGWTKFANIGLIPILIGVGAVAAGLLRGRRRSRRQGVQQEG